MYVCPVVTGDLNSLEMMALDVHAHGPRSLLLLVAAVNVARSPEMRYALGMYLYLLFMTVMKVSICFMHICLFVTDIFSRNTLAFNVLHLSVFYK